MYSQFSAGYTKEIDVLFKRCHVITWVVLRRHLKFLSLSFPTN